MLKYFVALQGHAMNKYDDLKSREDGQTMAEYGVVLAVITVAAIVAFQTLGGRISSAITQVTGYLP